jgi:hypothetical protein
LLPLLFLLACFSTPAHALEEAAGSAVTLFPSGDLYPLAIADPHRVGFGVQQLHFTDTAIPDAGDDRVGLRAGGRFGIVRVEPNGTEAWGWQASVEGGFNAQFDADHSLDNIGWDGRYGLVVTAGRAGGAAFKMGVLHDSSHVGDEYLLRTGRGRIGYTRHEVAAGFSWTITERWRTYAEAGWGYQLSNSSFMDPGRGQVGLEFDGCRGPRERCRGWYGAVDLSAMEEREWHVDTAVQAGLAGHFQGRIWRIGLEWYRGRPPLGEFFSYTESSLSIGIWLDV